MSEYFNEQGKVEIKAPAAKELNNHKKKELRQRQLCLVDLITGGFYEI